MGLEVDDTNSFEVYYAIIGKGGKITKRVELLNTDEAKREKEAQALCELGEIVLSFETERKPIRNMSGP